MFLADQIAGLFKVKYLKKEKRVQFDFLHTYKHQSILQAQAVNVAMYGQSTPSNEFKIC